MATIPPGTTVNTPADLRGKKIAYSPGQAQGALVLKVLKKAGLAKEGGGPDLFPRLGRRARVRAAPPRAMSLCFTSSL